MIKNQRKEYLKYELIRNYGSLTIASREIGLNYCRLSRFISGALMFNENELDKLTDVLKKLKISKKKAMAN